MTPLPLRERVEALAGGDREADALICAALEYAPDMQTPEFVDGYIRVWRAENDGWGNWRVCARAAKDGVVTEYSGCSTKPQPVTASLDAALALVERVRPGCEIQMNRFADGKCYVEIWLGHECFSMDGATIALALLAALLRSLEADAGDNHGS